MAEMKLKDFLLRAEAAADNAPEYMKTAARPLRVLVIQPPEIAGVRTLLPHFKEGTESIGYKPPLGILYVASILKERSIHTVRAVDCIAEQLTFDQLLSQVAAFKPDVVGISAWTDFWYPAWRSGEMIKLAFPHIHLTYGGPHLGIFPEETLTAPFVDSVIVGDGEIPFLYLCNMLSHGIEDNSFQGLHFKGQGIKPDPDTFYIHGDLDELPIPDRTLLPLINYNSVLSKEAFVTTMITSRGCPHQCTFCKLNFQKTLSRSAESVIEEFRKISDLGIKEVEIYDDTFTWSKERLRQICEGLIRENMNVTWAARDRVSNVDGDLLALMYKAGCRRIHYGVESGSQDVIDRMKKRITLDQARDAVRLAKQAGMTVLTYFMFGNLDETIEDMEKTIDFAMALDSDYAEFSITIPYAGTEMYLEALEKGIISYDFWGEYARAPVRNFAQPELIETQADLATLQAMLRKAVRAFYFRPRYILRELMKLESFIEFVRKIRMGARLLTSVYVK